MFPLILIKLTFSKVYISSPDSQAVNLAVDSECTACTAGEYCDSTGQSETSGLCAVGLVQDTNFINQQCYFDRMLIIALFEQTGIMFKMLTLPPSRSQTLLHLWSGNRQAYQCG